MKYAIDIITLKLKTTGMSQYEIDCLLSQFLEEEFSDYVEYMLSNAESIKRIIKKQYS